MHMGKACGLGGGFDEFSEDDPGQCRVRCDCSDSKFHSPSGGTCHMSERKACAFNLLISWIPPDLGGLAESTVGLFWFLLVFVLYLV